MSNALYSKYIENIYYNYNNSSYISFVLNLNIDVNRKSVNSSTVYVIDEDNNKIKTECIFDTKKIALIDIENKLVKDVEYKIVLAGGINGIKNIFGAYNDYDEIYSVKCILDAPVPNPIILNPSLDELVTKGFEIGYESYGHPVQIIISDDVEFKNEIVNTISYSSPYVSSCQFENDKQYFVKIKITNGTDEKIAATSFIYIDSLNNNNNQNNSNNNTNVTNLQNNEFKIVDTDNLILQVQKPIKNILIYKCKKSVADVILKSIDKYKNTDLVADANNEIRYTIFDDVVSFALNNITYYKTDNGVYIIELTYNDDTVEHRHFVIPRRQLYITYDELKPNITSFEYSIEDLYKKIEQACDEVDYYSVQKVKNTKIPIYVKDFIIDYIVLYLLDEYIKGNINIINGSIGSFSFTTSPASYEIVRSLYNEYKNRIIEHRNALYKQTRPGYAPPKSAVLGSKNQNISQIYRTQI